MNENEKAVNTMSKVGKWNLVLGIVTIVSGISMGVVLIVHGAKLIRQKYQILI